MIGRIQWLRRPEDAIRTGEFFDGRQDDQYVTMEVTHLGTKSRKRRTLIATDEAAVLVDQGSRAGNSSGASPAPAALEGSRCHPHHASSR